MSTVPLVLLALSTPIVLPAAVCALTSRLRFWWRSCGVVLASLASLPIGFTLMLIAHYPEMLSSAHVNPGVGVVAIPVMMLWFASFVFIGIGIIALATRKLVSRSQRH